ncbi:isoleucyl-tRNA synthetase [Halarchaeum rubridurum]|uniref:Isoleucine--tRNA ligase n=1 Tax=Halarchaeum rubridurum TaxID=489911 RepID=A0A830FY68_9EURY|nr:isoleucine--tRNA ligase [Halarchaeum rubridurum]MBP1954216.1 isoleucyl-tRNA synthetase [Halarchaeum rubridurum]GGM58242.1 isoleucine--tRNA ligase [Halarchaeum rubridurum]
MDRFAEPPEQYDPEAVRDRVFDYWDEVDAYEKTKAHREDGEDFFFVDGPPYTSGAAHMGTTWNKSLKDAYIRYYRMQGYDVTDRPGYDMHGLPIETKVEERLDFDSKQDIEEYGVEAFIDECKQFANEQLEGLQSDFQSFGVWMDWENPYKTVDPTYMEAAWWAFNRASERGLVEQGKRSISQCPRCETAIANNEVEYEDVEDPTVHVKFPLREGERSESSEGASGETASREGSLVIYTTTPWTIPANEFVAVGEDIEYAKVEATTDGESEILYVAEACVEDVLKAGRYDDYEVVESFPGSHMLGWEYDHPLAEEVPDRPDERGVGEVYHADYVEAEDTGLVHSAPGHGDVDFERGEELGLPVFCPVGGDGVYTEEAGKYAGEFVKDADEAITQDLARKGHLLASGTVTHSYGHCWRCDTPILQIATDQWFITITDVKDELIENMEDSEWHPQWARDNRFRDFIESAPDWNVSRQRYWGIPVPIWVEEGTKGEHPDERIVVGTREELVERADQDLDADMDIHKPAVDDVTITEDGVTYERVPDVFDVWLDSSVATWGTVNYPEEEGDFEELWPADLIMEAHDQTRGWFWSQLGMGTAAMGEVPYDEVLMHGFANDEDGRKMSKSVGNVVQPHEAIEKHGADAMRMFLLGQDPQGEDMRFSWDEMQNMQRDLNVLWNVFRFPLPYMRADDFDPDAQTVDELDLAVEDDWLLSKLQNLKHDTEEYWENREQHRALQALREFVVEDLSRYYIQLIRERVWTEQVSENKTAAYATLHKVLREVVALLAPYAPFVSEEVYGYLTGDSGHPTVHMCDWPEVEERFRQPALEDAIDTARSIEEAGNHARQQAGRKLRWPVARVVVSPDDDRTEEQIDDYRGLLADRLNARRIEVLEPGETFGDVEYSAEADMSVLGPAFGADAGDVMEALNAARVDDDDLDVLEDAVRDALDRDVQLTPEMVSFREETPDDVAAAAFEGGTVYVDTELDDDLEAEGYAREVVRRAQELRKDLDLDMEAEVRLDVLVFDDRVAELVSEREDLIAEEVRAREFEEVDPDDANTAVEEYDDVEGVRMRIGVQKV